MDYSDIEKFRRFIRDRLPPTRYSHSLAVGHVLEEASGIYGYNPIIGLATGILHDVAKELDHETTMSILHEHDQASLKHIGSCIHPCYLHGPAGAWIAKHELGINDEALLMAIRTHSGEYPGMSLFARCLHVADMTVPATAYKGTGKLAKLFFDGRLDEAELLLDYWLEECSGAKSASRSILSTTNG